MFTNIVFLLQYCIKFAFINFLSTFFKIHIIVFTNTVLFSHVARIVKCIIIFKSHSFVYLTGTGSLISVLVYYHAALLLPHKADCLDSALKQDTTPYLLEYVFMTVFFHFSFFMQLHIGFSQPMRI